MTIAEQLTRAKADLDAVYEAGKAAGGCVFENPLLYATQANRLYYNADFPQGHELFVEFGAETNTTEMFRGATGLRKITFKSPVDAVYNGSYLLYTTSARPSDLEELIFPDGIKFSIFNFFAQRCTKLHTIVGDIDLNESSDNSNCFYLCDELRNISFAKKSIVSSISFSSSPNLSDASILSIIGGLATVATSQTLTVPATLVSKFRELGLTEAYQEEINWTLGS